MPNKKPTIPSIANFIFCLPVHSSGNIPPQAINKNSPLKKENNKDITFFSILVYRKHKNATKNTIQWNIAYLFVP